MQFTISPSPSPEVVFRSYDPALFPKFQIIFEMPETANSLLRFLAQEHDEANRAVVMENRADKDVTALRYRWVMTSADGTTRKQTVSSDSYMVDVYRPVLKPQDRKLICLSTAVDESFLEHLLHGGGGVGGGGSRRSSLVGVASLRLEVDMLLFADGELAGPDIEKYAAELQCRKPAAEFIAKQVRLAESEHRDVTPVMSALAQAPYRRDDFLAHWTRHYAADYLRHSGNERMRVARLHHLENRPTVPKFYRPEGSVS